MSGLFGIDPYTLSFYGLTTEQYEQWINSYRVKKDFKEACIEIFDKAEEMITAIKKNEFDEVYIERQERMIKAIAYDLIQEVLIEGSV